MSSMLPSKVYMDIEEQRGTFQINSYISSIFGMCFKIMLYNEKERNISSISFSLKKLQNSNPDFIQLKMALTQQGGATTYFFPRCLEKRTINHVVYSSNIAKLHKEVDLCKML